MLVKILPVINIPAGVLQEQTKGGESNLNCLTLVTFVVTFSGILFKLKYKKYKRPMTVYVQIWALSPFPLSYYEIWIISLYSLSVVYMQKNRLKVTISTKQT